MIAPADVACHYYDPETGIEAPWWWSVHPSTFSVDAAAAMAAVLNSGYFRFKARERWHYLYPNGNAMVKDDRGRLYLRKL